MNQRISERVHVDPATADRGESAGPSDDLRATAAHSVKWAVLQMIGGTGGRLLFTLVFARLLGPDDFGIVAAAMVYIALVMLLLDQGFGAVIVQRAQLRASDVRTVSTLNFGLALVFLASTMLLAPLVADFFRTPELTSVLRVLGLGLIVKGLTIVPLMLSRRDFRFREVALARTASVFVGGFAGLAAIVAGADYWGLVVQTLVTDTLMFAALLSMYGRPRFGIDRSRLAGLFRFSSGLVGAQLMMFAIQNADNVVIGRVLGPTALAFYAVAYRLQRFPMQLVGSAVNDVALPVFARLQDQRVRMGNWFVTATKFVIFIVWPVLVLMAVGADFAVPVVFGDNWEQAIRPLQLLAVGALASISRWLLAPLCTAIGRTDLVFKWTAVNVVLYITGFLIAVNWGIDAVALSVGVVGITVAIPQSFYVTRTIGLRWSRYVRAHVPMVVGCLVLAIVWRSLAWGLDRAGASDAVVLVAATIPAVGGYLAAVRMLWPTALAESRAVIGLSRRGVRRPSAGIEPELGATG